MQNKPITYGVQPRVVSTDITEQHDAFLDALDECPLDHTQLTNAQWAACFSLMLGLRELLGPQRWDKHWQRIKAYKQHKRLPQNDVLDMWCWFERARWWRRDMARTKAGVGKARWKTLKSTPKKHAAHKQRNREAQRRRRARLSTPEHAE